MVNAFTAYANHVDFPAPLPASLSTRVLKA